MAKRYDRGAFMKIYFTSENKMYVTDTRSEPKEFVSQKIETYKKNISEIRQKSEWKHSGTGAAFTGTLRNPSDDEAINAYVCGLAAAPDGRLIYSVLTGEVGGLYYKSENGDENHITAAQNFQPFEMDCHDGKLAISVEYGGGTRHISVYDLSSGNMTELTDGDTLEECPCWSETGKELYFSTAGIGRNRDGIAAAVSPRGISVYSFEKNEMTELCGAEDLDYICPRIGKDGAIYYIKRPYKSGDDGNFWLDFLLFPVRIIKAIGGFLNAFSIMFGGESLSSDGKSFHNPLKAKQKDDKELFIAGNVINAEKSEKENRKHGDKNPGIIPHSWQLVRRNHLGEEEVVRKGVMDYSFTADGSLIVSDGKHLLKLSEGKEEILCKCRLAQNIVAIE